MFNMIRVAQAGAQALKGYGPGFWRGVCEGIPDGRAPNVAWPQWQLVGNAVFGKLADVRALRTEEVLTEMAHGGIVDMFGKGRLPDTTMGDWLKTFGKEAGYALTIRMASALHSRKLLDTDCGIRIRGQAVSMAVYDGKVSFISHREEEQYPYVATSYTSTWKMPDGSMKELVDQYWSVKLVRCILVTAAGPICVAMLPAEGNDEQAAVQRLDRCIAEDLPWLQKRPTLIMADAAHANSDFLNQQGDPYGEVKKVSGLGRFFAIKVKGNCPSLYSEALRAGEALIAARRQPDARDDWTEEGHGRRVKRELYLIDTALGRGRDEVSATRLDDYEQVANLCQKQWPTIRLIGFVRQTVYHKTAPKNGKPQSRTETRLLALNVKRKDISAQDVLTLLRKEWQVEVHHNLLDQIMREDDGLWANRGQAPLAMAAINSAAVNLLLLLRNRHLRNADVRATVSYPQLQVVNRAVLLGGLYGKLLQAEARRQTRSKRPQPQPLPPPDDSTPLPPEFLRQWSDADLAQLLTAIRTLLGVVAERIAGTARFVTLAFTWDAATKEVTQELSVR